MSFAILHKELLYIQINPLCEPLSNSSMVLKSTFKVRAHIIDGVQASILAVDGWQVWFDRAALSTTATYSGKPWQANKAAVFSQTDTFLQRCRSVTSILLTMSPNTIMGGGALQDFALMFYNHIRCDHAHDPSSCNL